MICFFYPLYMERQRVHSNNNSIGSRFVYIWKVVHIQKTKLPMVITNQASLTFYSSCSIYRIQLCTKNIQGKCCTVKKDGFCGDGGGWYVIWFLLKAVGFKLQLNLHLCPTPHNGHFSISGQPQQRSSILPYWPKFSLHPEIPKVFIAICHNLGKIF